LIVTNPVFVVKTRMTLQLRYATPLVAAAAVSGAQLTQVAAAATARVPADHYYSGVWDAFVKISQREGVRGLYRGTRDAGGEKEKGRACVLMLGARAGLVPSLAGVFHGVFQFVAYERMKHWLEILSERNQFELVPCCCVPLAVSLTAAQKSHHFLVTGAISKVAATVFSYPYQVVRSRIQVRSLARCVLCVACSVS
jgi:solute carrier family 25 folate transporter 32